MIEKIKNLVKKLTVVEWVVLAVSVFALVIGVANCHGGKHKGPHGGNKHVPEAVVEAPVK